MVNFQDFHDVLPKFGRKNWAAIGGEIIWNSETGEQVFEQEIGEFLRSDIFWTGNKQGKFRKSANNYQDAVEFSKWW